MKYNPIVCSVDDEDGLMMIVNSDITNHKMSEADAMPMPYEDVVVPHPLMGKLGWRFCMCCWEHMRGSDTKVIPHADDYEARSHAARCDERTKDRRAARAAKETWGYMLDDGITLRRDTLSEKLDQCAIERIEKARNNWRR